jgi:hypothetical protein
MDVDIDKFLSYKLGCCFQKQHSTIFSLWMILAKNVIKTGSPNAILMTQMAGAQVSISSKEKRHWAALV